MNEDDPADPSTVVFTEQSATYTWTSRDLTVEDLPDIHGRLISVGATGEERVNLVNGEMRVEVLRSNGALPARRRDQWVPLDQYVRKIRLWRIIAVLVAVLSFTAGVLL